MSLWKIFQYHFEVFREENFKSVNIHHKRKLWDSLQKFVVWIQKQQRYTITRLLYKALLKEKPTDQTKAEIIAYKKREKFALYQISYLIDSNFGKKP